MLKKKKAAIEMSIGTIVIIVIAMSMLVLGMILVRKVMCAGITLTDKVSTETENQIVNLFGSDEYGVKCMGEIDKAKIGSGGSRPVVCIVNTDKSEDYELNFKSATLLTGRVPGLTINGDASRIVISKGWKGKVGSGKTTIRVATLDIPRDVDTSNLRLVFEEKRGGTAVATHDVIVELVPIGTFTAAIC